LLRKTYSKALLTLAVCFIAASEPILVESDEMTCCGKEIALRGHVVIERDEGRVIASEAQIHRKEIELHRGVILHHRDGKRLTCEHAFLNSDSLQGRFCSDLLHGRVHYCDEEKNGLIVQCDRLDIDGVRSFCYQPAGVRQIQAFGSVKIAHGEGFRASADRVTYIVGDQRPNSMRPLEMAESNRWRPGGQSEVAWLWSDRMLRQDPLLADSSDLQREIIVLSGHVQFEQERLGFLQTDESLVILRAPHQGVQRIEQVVSMGTTQFDFANPIDGSMCTLICKGEVKIDQKQHRIDLKSASPQSQIHYLDERGHVYANEMKIDYLSSEEGIRGSKIRLTGNVRLQSGGLFADTPIPLQLAIADRLEYDPKREIMMMEALPGRHVLFLDESQDTRVSARKICYDRRDNAIEGFGDVRFSLTDPEIGKLKERFK
jgi:hypothetical protein